MFAQERTALILDCLVREPRQSAAELQKRLGISRSTLRRDLIELEEAGRVMRVHGGVVLAGRAVGEPSFDRKQRHAVRAKQAIAKAVAAEIAEGSQVFVDGGTTCLHAARLLMAREDLTLWTNSIRLLAEAERSLAAVHCIGGQVRGRSMSLFGGLAARWLGQLHVDVALIGASGVDAAGPRTADLNDASLKRDAIEAAERSWLLADVTKWRQPAAVRFAEWGHFDAWFAERSEHLSIDLPADRGCEFRRV